MAIWRRVPNDHEQKLGVTPTVTHAWKVRLLDAPGDSIGSCPTFKDASPNQSEIPAVAVSVATRGHS